MSMAVIPGRPGVNRVVVSTIDAMAGSAAMELSLDNLEDGTTTRVPLELEESGVSFFRLAPSFRMPFGHTHDRQEEVYLVVGGSARAKIGDDVVELRTWDALRVSPGIIRGLEAGPEGLELFSFGAPNTENKDAEVVPDWWPAEGG